MCFEADRVSSLNDGEPSPDTMNPFFGLAPQADLYPTLAARPSDAEVRMFLEAHSIEYVYVDPAHPTLVGPDAEVVASSGEFELIRVP
jgi:hypothetical protein